MTHCNDTGRQTPNRGGSDEQSEYEGPKTKLDQLFDHHGYQIYDAEDPTLDQDDLGAEEIGDDDG
jgi:hypothetical protein